MGQTRNFNYFNGVISLALARVPELEPWPEYYMLRGAELELIFKLYPFDSYEKALDIGIGNGFVTACLSRYAKWIVGLDLPIMDVKTHTYGLEKAKRLLDAVGIMNCSLVGGRLEELPFPDDHFDFIFTQYALEHIPDLDRAVSEIRRVLKPDGIIIAIVPGHFERVAAFFKFPYYLLSRGIFYFKNRFWRHEVTQSEEIWFSGRKGCDLDFFQRFKKFLRDYPHFPFPNPHGVQKNSFREMIAYTPGAWGKVFTKNGLFLKEVFSHITIFNSLTNIVYSQARSLERLMPLSVVLAKQRMAKYLGEAFCFVMTK